MKIIERASFYHVKIPGKKLRGLGDAVAVLAQPFALTIDAVAGTKITKCGACAKRQEVLNRAVPFG
jgi:hypothetical protein